MNIADIAKIYFRTGLQAEGDESRFRRLLGPQSNTVNRNSVLNGRTRHVMFNLIKKSMEAVSQQNSEFLPEDVEKEIDRTVHFIMDGWKHLGRGKGYDRKFNSELDVIDFFNLMEDCGMRIKREPFRDGITIIRISEKNHKEIMAVFKNHSLGI